MQGALCIHINATCILCHFYSNLPNGNIPKCIQTIHETISLSFIFYRTYLCLSLSFCTVQAQICIPYNVCNVIDRNCIYFIYRCECVRLYLCIMWIIFIYRIRLPATYIIFSWVYCTHRNTHLTNKPGRDEICKSKWLLNPLCISLGLLWFIIKWNGLKCIIRKNVLMWICTISLVL